MNTAEILEQLRAGHADWQAAVDQIPVERMHEPGLEGGVWSVRDEIAHVAFYDRWTAGTLAALARGTEPAHRELYDHEGEMPKYAGDLDAHNENILSRYDGMSPEEVVAAANSAFADLEAAIEAVPEQLWAEPTELASGKTLAEVMPGQTWVHYAKHLPPLQAFIARSSSS